MTAYIRTGAAVLLLLAVAGSASAQAPQRITYADAVTIALRQNPSVLLAHNARESSEAAVSQQKMQFLPDLRLSTSTGQSIGRTFNQNEGSIVNQTTRSFNAGVSSSVTLFDGFRNVAELKGAELARDAAGMDLERAQQTAVFTVSSQFLALVEGAEQLKVQTEALQAQEAEEKQIQKLVDAGARPIADLYQQQASVASARAALVAAQRAAKQAELDLVQTLQLDPTASYEFVAPAVNTSADSSAQYVLNDLVARALQNRADLDAASARAEAAEQGIRAAAASRWPTVSVSAGYNTGASSASDLGFANQLDQRRGGSLSLSVSVPLFDRNAARTASQQAQIQAENAQISLASQKQAIAVQVRKALLDFESAKAQLSASEAQLVAAEKALESTRQRYNAGVATLVEVTQSRAAQVQAASAVVNARYTLALQRTLVDYYTGELKPVSLG